METFKITTLLSQKEYIKLMFYRFFTKPVFLVMVTSVIMAVGLGVIGRGGFSVRNLLPLFVLYGFLLPMAILFTSYRTYKKSNTLQHQITYTFSEDNLHVALDGVDSTINWEIFISRELKLGFLLLYTNHVMFYILPVRCFKKEQLMAVKAKVPKKKAIL
jgi:hypothetical protein